ncbi:MAG: acyl-CoA thioesterase [Sulfurimonas sp.]|nr:acyl-CoA thioesterase [Sulfurimonas sp.]
MKDIDRISYTKITVRYSQVDKMNQIYYSRYLEYFEVARIDYLHDIYTPYDVIENKFKVLMPVIESYIKISKPSRFNDKLNIKTSLEIVSEKRFKFTYSIFNKEMSIVAKGYTTHVFVSETSKSVLILNDVFKLISK